MEFWTVLALWIMGRIPSSFVNYKKQSLRTRKSALYGKDHSNPSTVNRYKNFRGPKLKVNLPPKKFDDTRFK
ncbi:unnamed protein product, partial [Nesidiocoris tenuis]